MVAKIESGKKIRGILYYNEDKVAEDKAQLILASGFAGDIDKMNLLHKLNRFKHLTGLNTNVKTNALHITLNFDASDKLDNTKLQQIASEYMERIGFGEQPFLVYRHYDTNHAHIHIATTNIQRNGERIDIHGIGYRLSEPARKQLEEKYNLVKAEGRKLYTFNEISRAKYGEMPTKKIVSSIVAQVAREYAFTSFAEYKAVLQCFGILADRGTEGSVMFEKKGLQYSVLDKNGNAIGVPLKASSIYGRPILKNIEEKFEKNRERREKHKDNLTHRLDLVFSRMGINSIDKLKADLSRYGIDMVARISDTGRLYGITYIDQQSRTVFNGSDLGKAFSAKAIEDMLTKLPIEKHRQKPLPSQRHFPSNHLEQKNHTNFLKTVMMQADYSPSIGLPKQQKKRKRKKQNQQTNQLTI